MILIIVALQSYNFKFLLKKGVGPTHILVNNIVILNLFQNCYGANVFVIISVGVL